MIATIGRGGGSQQRFAARSSRSRNNNAHDRWEEAVAQVELGWPDNTFPIPISGILPGIYPEGVNVAFRFGVQQEKLRACGDLRNNKANLLRPIITPITLPMRDNFAQSFYDVTEQPRGWALSKADRA